MRYIKRFLAVFICVLAIGCKEEKPQAEVGRSLRDLSDHRILSYSLNDRRMEYATPEFPEIGKLAGRIDHELNLSFGGKSNPDKLPFSLPQIRLDQGDVLMFRLQILHLDNTGGKHYELHCLLTAKHTDKGQYRVEYFDAPFSSPTLIGDYPSIAKATQAARSKIGDIFEEYKARYETE